MASTSVFLNVKDFDRSLKFYKSLGFKVVGSMKDDAGKLTYADLVMDGAELGLGAIASNDDKGFQDWVSTPLGAGVMIYFTVSGVDKLFARAKKAGATVEVEPMDRPYGRIAMINDPDGYVLSLHQDAPKRAAKKAAKKAARSPKRGAKRSVKRSR